MTFLSGKIMDIEIMKSRFARCTYRTWTLPWNDDGMDRNGVTEEIECS